MSRRIRIDSIAGAAAALPQIDKRTESESQVWHQRAHNVMGRPLHYSHEVSIAAGALCGCFFSRANLRKLPLFSWPDFTRVLFSPMESSPYESPQTYRRRGLKKTCTCGSEINGTHGAAPMDVNNKQINKRGAYERLQLLLSETPPPPPLQTSEIFVSLVTVLPFCTSVVGMLTRCCRS